MTDPHPGTRTALVTGGAQGIGAAIATRLAADGYRVAVLDLNAQGAAEAAAEITRAGGTARPYVADVTDPGSVEDAHRSIVDELGAPSVLVNNAGVTRDNLLFRMTEDDWDTVMGVHLRGAFLLSRIAHSHMREIGWGRIVNLSSTSAGGNRGQANYSAAKAGIVGLTLTLAKELGRFGITANCVAPGFIDTAMLRATADRLGVAFDDFTAANVDRIPVRRIGSVEDVADAVSFLASERASYITGETIHVSGGFRE
ncbi:3-oxoacyl-[acyl-carrier protein] reductase [Microbacterium resistens]|uniref:3-oxoacyl-[acyl-carrier protein] reductase n=1 Tax=Microbacterium resistens TaxID=156977 RepID=A0ABU1SAM0_9MICO|nr:3-oxoacyl-ACP reductase FabG [Microbacterium resistens]MDR6866616.1 3-oxoacyl-[acyl-carrier protein] reductase [Microbacterium resistens]